MPSSLGVLLHIALGGVFMALFPLGALLEAFTCGVLLAVFTCGELLALFACGELPVVSFLLPEHPTDKHSIGMSKSNRNASPILALFIIKSCPFK